MSAKRFRQIAAQAAIVVFGTATLAAQQARPDFSGTWVLDITRSDQSQSTPTSATYVVTQRGDTLHYDRDAVSMRGATTSHVTLDLAGGVARNTLAQNGQDVETSSRVTWAHDTLVIQSNGDMGGTPVVTFERWSVSPDRRALLTFREVSVNGQVYASTNLWFTRKE